MILVVDTAEKKTRLAVVYGEKIEQISFEGGRELSSKLYENLDCLYKKIDQSLDETKSIIVNAGPGSFTGLRIGISAANALAYSLDIPIVGVSSPTDIDDLVSEGKKLLNNQEKFNGSVVPEYGAEPNITKPKNN